MSIHTCVRLDRRLFSTSMRTCSRCSSVRPAATRNDQAKRYHCTSRKALELVLKTLRTIALRALITVAARMSQMAYLPTWALSQSMARDSLSKPCITSPFLYWMPRYDGTRRTGFVCQRVGCVRRHEFYRCTGKVLFGSYPGPPWWP
ncbi:hypothetical protein FQZ97_1032750 [compost metagenome]